MKVNGREELMEQRKDKIIRSETLLWIKKLDTWCCYDHDDQGNRILIGEYHNKEMAPKNDSKTRLLEDGDIKRQRAKERCDKRPRSKYKGVVLHIQAYRAGRDKVWQSGTTLEGKKHHFGTFRTDHEAAMAYDKGIRKLSIDRKLNFS